MKNIFLLFLSLATTTIFAQTNILSTNPTAFEVLLGNYNAADYLPSNIINHPDDLVSGIHKDISADSLKAYIIRLSNNEKLT